MLMDFLGLIYHPAKFCWSKRV